MREGIIAAISGLSRERLAGFCAATAERLCPLYGVHAGPTSFDAFNRILRQLWEALASADVAAVVADLRNTLTAMPEASATDSRNSDFVAMRLISLIAYGSDVWEEEDPVVPASYCSDAALELCTDLDMLLGGIGMRMGLASREERAQLDTIQFLVGADTSDQIWSTELRMRNLNSDVPSTIARVVPDVTRLRGWESQ